MAKAQQQWRCSRSEWRYATGGVIRDNAGDWRGGFLYWIESGSAVMAELWGIYHGLQIAWRKGTQFLILQSDSNLVLDLIKQTPNPLHRHANILGGIHRMLSQNWVV
ncbi:unnamed protein product [Linum trigynum]|uniref:RNase H type-1 domain-containing protein n=1 Tax=Linum trigynum TaxID=586398 RepID=A0AAV2CY67_9ROSI